MYAVCMCVVLCQWALDMYVCMCVCVFVCKCACACVCMCQWALDMHVCAYVPVGAGCVCVYACVCVCQWALDVASGLSFLHSRKPFVLHRDLKPVSGGACEWWCA